MLGLTDIYDVVEKLSDERKNVIYRLAVDMFTAQQSERFDDFSPEEIKRINASREKMRNNDCVSFMSSNEMLKYFDED